MTTVPSGQLEWRKSSRSSGQDTCVEVRRTLKQVRDSKNPSGPVLNALLPALVAAVKDGKIGA